MKKALVKKQSQAITEKKVGDHALATLDAQIERALAGKHGVENARQLLLNTLLTSNQEFILLIDEILQNRFHLSDEEITELHQLLSESLSVSRSVHLLGHRTLDLDTQKKLVDIAAINSVQERKVQIEKQFGLHVPTQFDSEKLLKG